MGLCSCGLTLVSPAEAAAMLGVTPQRVRGVLARDPFCLQAFRVGVGWVIPAPAVSVLNRTRLGSGQSSIPAPPICPGCGSQLFSPAGAAAMLGAPLRELNAILTHHPSRLAAFRVGRFWIVPQQGLHLYRSG